MEKTIKKRTFNGSKDNIFTSPYYTSKKWGVIVLIEPTETHMGGVGTQIFATKKECENYAPQYGGEPFEDFAKAKEYFLAYSKAVA